MDTLGSFEMLVQKVEQIVEKYENIKNDKIAIEKQLLSQEAENAEMKNRLQELNGEREVIKSRIDTILAKIEELGI